LTKNEAKSESKGGNALRRLSCTGRRIGEARVVFSEQKIRKDPVRRIQKVSKWGKGGKSGSGGEEIGRVVGV